MQLSNKAEKISSSLTLAISSKAKKMKAEGENVIGFGAGEPDFDTPEYIKKAAREALDRGYTGYTSVQGMEKLRHLVSDRLQANNNLNFDPSQILVSNGAKHSLFNALQVLINPGDEVLIPVPYWVSYPELVKMAGGRPVFVQGTEDMKIIPRQLDEMISPATRVLILNSPSNPAGIIYNRYELKQLAEIIIKNNLVVISDEIYDKIIYDNRKHISIAALGTNIKERTIVINGMSKTYAMTGWRIGFAAGPQKIIKCMTNFQSHSTSNANSIAQYASIIGLQDKKRSQEHLQQMLAAFRERRNYILQEIDNTPGLTAVKPAGAFYIMINISDCYQKGKIEDSISFARKLLNNERVAVVPGKAFGRDDYIRLSFASSMAGIKEGFNRIKNFVKMI